MSSSEGSVHSFDNESELTLLNGEKFDGYEDYQNEKTAYHVDARPYLTSTSSLLSLSSSSVAYYFAILLAFCKVLTPSFIPWGGQKEGKPEKLHPSAYLDGMRGLAAFAVFLCHLSYGTWDLTHVYGAGKPGENTHFLQLPVVRLLYSGPPMVAIFFVISGYALSYKPIKLMRSQKQEELMTATTSSVFRRAFRLYLPCFASTFFIICLIQLGFYERTRHFAQNMRAVKEEHARMAPDAFTQLNWWSREMFAFINVFDWSLYSGTIPTDPHLWTIPAEYRCSLALFLTHILVARMSSKARLLTLVGLSWWGLHWNRFELIPFWAGAFLAELDHIRAARATDEQSDLALDEKIVTSKNDASFMNWDTLYIATFICGLYLASFPDYAGHETPGYIYLNSLIPQYWHEKHRFWPNIAAVMIVWSSGRLVFLKNIFTSAPIQYLGNISFPLYVMHGPVIHTFGYSAMGTIYAAFGVEDLARLKVAFAMAAALTILAVIWASDIFWRVVDKPCVRFSKWLEGKVFIS